MSVTYKKLFKLLIDRKMKKKDLQALASLGTATMSKLSKDENVSMDVLVRICTKLDVDIGDIVEIEKSPESNIDKRK